MERSNIPSMPFIHTMKTIIISLLLMVPAFCMAQSLPKKFAAIKPGTSEADVIKQVGEPVKIERFVTVKNNSYDTSRYWRYDRDVIVVFTNHAVERVVPKWEQLLKTIQQRANRKDEEGIKIIPGE